MCKITIVGDVHGWIDRYKETTDQHDYTVQVGDVGFDREYVKLIHFNIDPTRHRIVMGNHDNPNFKLPHSLGDFGVHSLNNINFFFIRGAESVDKIWRTLGRDYFENEQLDWAESNEAIQLYSKIKPNFIISHTCPSSVVQSLLRPHEPFYSHSHTSRMLQIMLEEHRPCLWVFGHWHRNRILTKLETTFVCLDELSWVEINQDLSFTRTSFSEITNA